MRGKRPDMGKCEICGKSGGAAQLSLEIGGTGLIGMLRTTAVCQECASSMTVEDLILRLQEMGEGVE
jgi:hypothetical protein